MSTTSVSPDPVRIALAGPMGSGKTFVAEWLQRRYGSVRLRRIGFGDEVKRLVQELWDPPKKDRALLVEFATSMRIIDPAIWIKRLLATMEASPDAHWVCDDLRQDNELVALRERGWLLVRILVPEGVRRQRIRDKYPNDYEEHLSYGGHKTERDMLQTPADVFDLTIDTSDGGMWCDLLEKTVSNRWGLSPSPMETPPTSPEPSPLVLSEGARGDEQGRTLCGYAVECLLFSASVAVGVGSWLWMLRHVVLDAQANNQTAVEALLEWHRYGDAYH
jgi:hypothetical protein